MVSYSYLHLLFVSKKDLFSVNINKSIQCVARFGSFQPTLLWWLNTLTKHSLYEHLPMSLSHSAGLHTHTLTQTHTRAQEHAQEQTHGSRTQTHNHTHTTTHTDTNKHTQVQAHTHTHTHTHTQIQIQTHTHSHECKHIHTQTHSWYKPSTWLSIKLKASERLVSTWLSWMTRLHQPVRLPPTHQTPARGSGVWD